MYYMTVEINARRKVLISPAEKGLEFYSVAELIFLVHRTFPVHTDTILRT